MPSLYAVTIPVFIRQLGNLSAILDKARTHADASGIAQAELTEARLATDGKGRLLHLGQFDEPALRELIDRHLRYTASAVALRILDNWETCRGKFVKVFPSEYKRALGELAAREARTAAAKQLVRA